MEAIEILEGSEGHNEEISKIWNYVLKNLILKDTESLHRVLTQCCNRLVLSNGYDERSTNSDRVTLFKRSRRCGRVEFG